MASNDSPLFPPGDWWLPIVPLVPLIVFTLFLSGIIDFERQQLEFLAFDFEAHYLAPVLRDYTHLGDLLVYYSVALLHVFVCLAVIVYFLHLMRALPRPARLGSLAFLAAAVVILAAVTGLFARWANDIVLVQLGFKATCVAIDGANLATRLLKPGACFEEGYISTLTWLAWIPTFAGMAAVVFAASFAYGNARGLPPRDDPGWRAAVEPRLRALQRSVYALSAVLVTSTIAITLFASLPTSLFGPSGGDLARAMSGYVGGLSTFWGVLFTLTLVATFAVPAYRILHQAYGQEPAVDEAGELRAWLHEHVFVSFRKQIGNAFVVLAPLLAGSFSSVFSYLVGG